MRLYLGERSPTSSIICVLQPPGVPEQFDSGLPDVIASEAPDRDVFLELRNVLGDVLLHREARLAEVWLLEQAVLLQEILDLALDDLRDDLLRLAVLQRLGLEDILLGHEDVVGHVLARNPARLVAG